MSLLRTLDRTSAVSQHQTPYLGFLCPVLQQKNKLQRSFSHAAIKHVLPTAPSGASPMEAVFIRALVRAGSCSKHTSQIHTLRNVVPRPPQNPKTRRKQAPDLDQRLDTRG